MKFILLMTDTHAALGRLLDHFRSLLLLGMRLYVAWPHWQSRSLRIGTVELLRAEHHAAGVSTLAGVVATTGFLCAALLLLGLFARVGALGALCVLAAIAAADATPGDRYTLPGFMLLVLATFGPGRVAVDTWLERRSAARCRPATAALASSEGPA